MLRLFSALIIGALTFGTVFVQSPGPLAAPALTARTSDAAGVRVVVTPKILGPGVAAWEFEVVMDTHTKPLNENLTQVAVLVDDTGRRYALVGWRGDPPGGHHRKGILRFAAPKEMPGAVELQIAGIGGAGTRTFRWELR
jgi:hypothetical protein